MICIKTHDFYYDLPQELIAQTPLQKRDTSRLLTLNKVTGETGHYHFYDLPKFLKPGDCLVLNDSRVLPARLIGHRVPTGGVCEVVLLIDRGENTWECLVRPGKKLREGAKLSFGEGELTAEVTKVLEGGNRLIQFHYEGIFLEILEHLGKMPLPPYIKEELQDAERYQTVYSKEIGSAAAPTAGLHFTKELLQKIKEIGCEEVFVTLHVGLGTFRPVSEAKIEDHKMHKEFYTVSQEAADAVNKAKAEGRRIIAVGTTAVRTLEAAGADGQLHAGSSWTNIFIYPGYKFRLVDDLVTNFHLPQSTLLMLVSTLSTREIMLQTYKKAVEEKYRFFSFGDAMFITDLNK